jgi:hypothetical protein
MTNEVIRLILRAEGAAVFLLGALAAYVLGGLAWWLVVLVLLAPDIGIAGYALGPRRGATLYNALHTYAGPTLLGLVALLASESALGAVAALWAAHIGFDRALGYGLKLGSFGETHLGRIGRG